MGIVSPSPNISIILDGPLYLYIYILKKQHFISMLEFKGINVMLRNPIGFLHGSVVDQWTHARVRAKPTTVGPRNWHLNEGPSTNTPILRCWGPRQFAQLAMAPTPKASHRPWRPHPRTRHSHGLPLSNPLVVVVVVVVRAIARACTSSNPVLLFNSACSWVCLRSRSLRTQFGGRGGD